MQAASPNDRIIPNQAPHEVVTHEIVIDGQVLDLQNPKLQAFKFRMR